MEYAINQLIKSLINPTNIIIFILLILVTVFYKKIRGFMGEFWVKQELKKLPKDKYIIINVNMFARENQVFIVAPDEDMMQVGAYTIEQLPEVISNLAHESDIYKVKIAGGTKYGQLIEFGIGTSEMLKYNERKIEVEVI